ncbi:GvpL/GvpF family gas vesicle protein [Streptomyces sp. NPDC017993]|uniref:GvpL/GvpF family gas vesicle protein n=1 Tax=Streptomyces sp. NPDC017993 TaxID=3365027 RepID=UPI0037B206CE
MTTQTSSGVREDAPATYVFAVCRRVDPAALTGLPGLAAGAPVRALPVGPLTAVVQHVPAAAFTEESWQQRLSDRQELERCARAHHEVVTAAAACGPTAPLALATLYRGDERARQALGEDMERFAAALDRIEGHAEWGIKVYLPAAATTGTSGSTATTVTEPSGGGAAGPRPDRDGAGSVNAGRAYLERKRGLQRSREERHDRVLQTAEDVDAALCRLATASRRLRTHSQEVTGEKHRLQVLNAAYLVAAEREQALADMVAALHGRTGAQIEMSGPWAPYSFAGEV